MRKLTLCLYFLDIHSQKYIELKVYYLFLKNFNYQTALMTELSVCPFDLCFIMYSAALSTCAGRWRRPGVSWISVHGRTKDQRKQPADMDAIRLIRENVNIPVVANRRHSGPWTMLPRVVEETGVNGIFK